MKNEIKESLYEYKQQIELGYIQKAYVFINKFIAKIKSDFPDVYKVGNISFGYLDYTYFSFFNDYLRKKKLRFGIVFNHKNMQFELWLMGQNAKVQKEYFNILKESFNLKEINKYSILEIVLENDMSFNENNIIDKAINLADGIQSYLKELDRR